MKTVEKIPVQFIRKNAPYNVGEIAGFPPAVSARLVARKRAVYVNADGEPIDEAPEAEEEEVEEQSEDLIEPIHVGGGYYDVGGERIQGKEAAQERADELNAGD